MPDLATEQALMASAYLLAQNSPDPSTQNGALVAVDDGELTIGEGWNDFPPGVTPVLEGCEKYMRIEHAERNALFNMWDVGYAPFDSTMYALWAACPDCARAIIASGISDVVTHKFYDDKLTKWSEGIDVANAMFDEAGVKRRSIFVPLGPIRFQGEVVTL